MNGFVRGDLWFLMNYSCLVLYIVYGRFGCFFCDLMVDNNKSLCIFIFCLGLFEKKL